MIKALWYIAFSQDLDVEVPLAKQSEIGVVVGATTSPANYMETWAERRDGQHERLGFGKSRPSSQLWTFGAWVKP